MGKKYSVCLPGRLKELLNTGAERARHSSPAIAGDEPPAAFGPLRSPTLEHS